MSRFLLILSSGLISWTWAFGGIKHPNIVYLISDDQAYTDFGFMGHPQVQTPPLDRLAAQSAFYPNGYVTSSVCRPSLATLLTGLYPFQHGIHFNHPPPGFKHLTQDPALIWYAPFLPHVPHDAPRRFYDLYRGKGVAEHLLPYFACISWFDETAGHLIQAIEERDLAENTLFIFVADNGFEPDPDRPHSYTRHSKRSPFEPGLRSPILLR